MKRTMTKTILSIAFMLVSMASISQITLSTKLIMGKDTILLKKGQSIAGVIDSLNKIRLDKYYAEQKRIEDSTQQAIDTRIKEGPHLYYNTIDEDGRSYIESQFDFEEGKKIVDTMKVTKIDTIETYSDMANEVLAEINSLRSQKLEIDSMRQQLFAEDMIYTYYLRKGYAVLEKNVYKKCPTECYKEVFARISRKKKLINLLASADLEYLNIAIIEDKRNVITFINYQEKNKKKDRYKIVYIR